MNNFFNFIYWLKIFLSPFIFFGGVGVAIYINNKDLILVGILLGIVGLTVGILWAEKIRKNQNTTEYMGRIFNTDDIKSYDEIVSDEKINDSTEL